MTWVVSARRLKWTAMGLAEVPLAYPPPRGAGEPRRHGLDGVLTAVFASCHLSLMPTDGGAEVREDGDDALHDTPLAVTMGSQALDAQRSRSLRICVDGDAIAVTAKHDRVYDGSTSRWRRAGVITGNDDGERKTYRFYLIEADPSAAPQSIEFEPFRVEGRFKILGRAGNRAASEAFKAFETSVTAKSP